MAMSYDHDKKLSKNRKAIMRDVRFGDVKDHLVSCDTLSLRDMEDIDSWRSPPEKMCALLDLLPRRGAQAYPNFCEALKDSHPWIVKEMNSTIVEPQPQAAAPMDIKRERVNEPVNELNHSVLTRVTNSDAIRNYKSIVRSLGLTEADIYQEEHANQGNPKEQFYQCLVKWQNKSGRSATPDALIEALREADCVPIADRLDGYE